jgi:predicted nicotinamide N-methyase
VWPASLALARLLAHCPSFCAGRRVLELGAGLGLVGSAAAAAGAASLLMADRDARTLAMAARSAALNAPQLAATPGGVGVLTADWSVPDDWRVVDAGSSSAGSSGGGSGMSDDGGAFDLVIGSDILYDESAAAPVADLLARVLLRGRGTGAQEAAVEGAEAAPVRRALLADAPQRLHRDAFVAACAARGLAATPSLLPGPEGTILLNVIPA